MASDDKKRRAEYVLNRQKIVNELVLNPFCTVDRVIEVTGLSRPTALKHLRELKQKSNKSSFIEDIIMLDSELIRRTSQELVRRIQNPKLIEKMQVRELVDLSKMASERRSVLGGDKTDSDGMEKSVEEMDTKKLLELVEGKDY